MLRLFLTLIAFLGVAVSGLWQSLTAGPALDQGTYENAPIILDDHVSLPVDTPHPAEELAPVQPMPTSPDNPAPEASDESTLPPSAHPAPPLETKTSKGLLIQPHLLRFGYRTAPSPRQIDTIVLHSSYNILGGDPYSVERTIEEYEQYGVGAHYLIDRSGTIYRLVEESNIAYHAGVSKMPDGRKNVNDFSVGIEMVATEESGYTDKQYAAVNTLIADIKNHHKIKSVVGHSDIAPGRKTDPWKFDWKRLQ